MTETNRERERTIAFAAVTTLFFAWGFITSNNDPLIVAVRAAFHLDYTDALLTQIVFFLAYGLLSLPAAWLTSRIGAVDMILGSLGLMAGGCLLVVASTGAGDFPTILAALFVLAAGFTALQVAANPLAAELGPPQRSHFRLNFAQAFNSLGVVIGVHFGSLVMLGDPALRNATHRIMEIGHRTELLHAVERAFTIMAALLAAMLVFFAFLRGFLVRAAPNHRTVASQGMFEALRSPWALFGAAAIGLYVGAEVSVGSIMINFLNQRSVLALPFDDAGAYLANFYWGGALCGRLIGTALLTRISATRLLSACGIIAALLCLSVIAAGGPIAGYSALAIGLFNSIMFPTIFSITLERSGVSRSSTSGLLCVAIFGGALLPIAVGRTADMFGLNASFAIPLVAYAFIAFFAVAARHQRGSGAGGRAADERLADTLTGDDSMISAFLLLSASAFTVTNSVYHGPVKRPANARLVWHDEFDGKALDTSKWEYDTSRNKEGWFNGEKQYYSAGRNLSVADGLLTIEARHEKLDAVRFPDWGGQEYTSARIFSKGSGWKYGFYEIRAKLPCARGTWPAIWMLPVHMEKWPDDGEIDIMEQVGAEPNVIYASLHTKFFNHVLNTQRSAQKIVPTSCTAFHVYQLDWRPHSITIGVDGHGILRVFDNRPGGKGAWPFFTPFRMILNLAIGGDWAAAKGIDDAAMPQRMQVDYVRVWQLPGRTGK